MGFGAFVSGRSSTARRGGRPTPSVRASAVGAVALLVGLAAGEAAGQPAGLFREVAPATAATAPDLSTAPDAITLRWEESEAEERLPIGLDNGLPAPVESRRAAGGRRVPRAVPADAAAPLSITATFRPRRGVRRANRAAPDALGARRGSAPGATPVRYRGTL